MSKLLLLDQRTRGIMEEYRPDETLLKKLGCFFSVFSDVTRLKIISALCVSEMCVSDISAVLDINQTTISHQLKVLRDVGIVNTKRQGKIVFYSVNVDDMDRIMMCGVDFLGL